MYKDRKKILNACKMQGSFKVSLRSYLLLQSQSQQWVSAPRKAGTPPLGKRMLGSLISWPCRSLGGTRADLGSLWLESNFGISLSKHLGSSKKLLKCFFLSCFPLMAQYGYSFSPSLLVSSLLSGCCEKFFACLGRRNRCPVNFSSPTLLFLSWRVVPLISSIVFVLTDLWWQC